MCMQHCMFFVIFTSALIASYFISKITIKEEDRLASVIADIDEDVKIVPRAAFIKTPTGLVVPNRSFEGKTFLVSSVEVWFPVGINYVK